MKNRAIAVGLLFAAAGLRLIGLNWDAYHHYHPDERYIAWVGTTIEWPESWRTALQPQLSTLNPFYWPAEQTTVGVQVDRDQPRRYAYGHFPLYLMVAGTRLAERLAPTIGPWLPEQWALSQDILNQAGWNEFRYLTIIGRLLTAFVDLGSVALLIFLGRALFNSKVGLLASAFLAINVMHIQLAHFHTVDPYLTFFVLLALTGMVMALLAGKQGKNKRLYLILTSVALGLAVGSKFGGVLLLLPLGLTIWLMVDRTLKQKAFLFLAVAGLAFLVFALTNPFAILDFSCVVNEPIHLGPFSVVNPLANSCYLQNVVAQGSMVRGARDVPFVRQYSGTIPFLYFAEMQLRWGMGPLLGLASIAGFGWAVWRAVRTVGERLRRRKAGEPLIPRSDPFSLQTATFPVSSGELVVLAWTAPFFITTGLLFVKFMRYLQPLIPFLMVYAAAMLMSIKVPLVRRLVIGAVLLATGLYAASFVGIYREPHPWIAASEWIYQNVDGEAVIVSEMWDDNLPDNITEDGELRNQAVYEMDDVNWLSGTKSADSPEKLAQNLALIAGADYLVLASNRNYGVISRLPDRYPLSSQYYPLLFDGSLGYDVVYSNTRTPNLFGWHLKPNSFSWPKLEPPDEITAYLDSLPGLDWGRFDESFTVYDQPLVIILENNSRLTAGEMAGLFTDSRLDGTK